MTLCWAIIAQCSLSIQSSKRAIGSVFLTLTSKWPWFRTSWTLTLLTLTWWSLTFIYGVSLDMGTLPSRVISLSTLVLVSLWLRLCPSWRWSCCQFLLQSYRSPHNITVRPPRWNIRVQGIQRWLVKAGSWAGLLENVHLFVVGKVESFHAVQVSFSICFPSNKNYNKLGSSSRFELILQLILEQHQTKEHTIVRWNILGEVWVGVFQCPHGFWDLGTLLWQVRHEVLNVADFSLELLPCSHCVWTLEQPRTNGRVYCLRQTTWRALWRHPTKLAEDIAFLARPWAIFFRRRTTSCSTRAFSVLFSSSSYTNIWINLLTHKNIKDMNLYMWPESSLTLKASASCWRTLDSSTCTVWCWWCRRVRTLALSSLSSWSLMPDSAFSSNSCRQCYSTTNTTNLLSVYLRKNSAIKVLLLTIFSVARLKTIPCLLAG